MTSDLELLQRYEPILRFTQGELFFPTTIEGYLAHCSLWRRTDSDTHELLVPAGHVTVEDLALYRDPGVYLRFVEEPLTGAEYQRWAHNERPPFKAPGRLARVGLLSRFADGLFTLSLLMRGRVPGGTTAAAWRQYRASVGASPPYVYYGRVVRESGYVGLHYLFFYCMNDWRSSFFGVNDHEADWEQLFVYVSDEEDGRQRPLWIAASAHDYFGDDLRRRWDDPEITIEGDHPVLFVGGGSHAHYFEAGEYLTPVGLKALRPLERAGHAFERLWRNVLRQGQRKEGAGDDRVFSLPFVDYARGDGRVIGPGHLEWTPQLVDQGSPWVQDYRGLWGLDTDDIFDGELAPAGPAFTRAGAVRQSWYDPLAWAGLEKVPPPAAQPAAVRTQIIELEKEREDAAAELGASSVQLRGLEVEVEALRARTRLKALREEREKDLSVAEKERGARAARVVSLSERIEASHAYLENIEAGGELPPEAHLHHKRHPDPPQRQRLGRLAELWAAVSVGIVLLAAAIMLWQGYGQIWLIGFMIGVAVLVDAILRGYVERLLLNCTVVLAAISGLILLYEFYWQAALVAIGVVGLIILRDNIRELRGR